MPLFEIDSNSELVPFRQLRGGSKLYESEIEDLLWANLDEFTGESLFPIARQPPIAAGGRPDIVALDSKGDVVVVEVKRDVDRGQLAQCLEYAGWARTTSLDELARIYHRDPAAFFADWQGFTESSTRVVLTRTPRLMLVARDFHGRTESAFDFLIENGLPVTLIRVSLYEDLRGRRFLDVEGDHEPEFAAAAADAEEAGQDHTKLAGRRVRVSDLLDAELIETGEALSWERPRLAVSYRATVLENGSLELEDGRVFSSPSRAAKEAADIPAYDGWYAWKVIRLEGKSLNDLRIELSSLSETDS